MRIGIFSDIHANMEALTAVLTAYESENIDSYHRYIYIHGTAEEEKIGAPASHGCVRMRNRDVIELFDRVDEGCKVYIQESL